MRDDSSTIAKILPLEPGTPPGAKPQLSLVVGWVVADSERLLVDFIGNPGGPLAPRWLSGVSRAVQPRDEVLLVFDGGHLERPIIVGLLAPDLPDNERIDIEARDEVALHCGKASLILRRNGRVIIRGTFVEARSSGRTRIVGTTVEIN